ncbi:MAG: hemin uptake protein HemP [Rubrivivax sp.]|jgi:hemin uptake protein HemP
MDALNTHPPRPAAEPADAPRAVATPRIRPTAPRRLDSSSLFAGAVEIEIEHQDQVYRLRKTSLGKLILTK